MRDQVSMSLDSEALQQLQSEQKALLDTIDSLRTLGVGRLVDLPQLVVVGDQSSGKSSVLEAISRVRFPVHHRICTRFATEFVLRTAPSLRIEVRMEAGQYNGERNPTSDFHRTSFGKDELPDIIEEAKEKMGLDADTTSISEDILRVEISGPDIPQLTLIDLPGFYHHRGAGQSAEGKAVVDRLAERYMSKSNSIILAIISTNNAAVMHKVLEEAQRHDPNGERTLGIITKPDLVLRDSPSESDFIQLARNGDSTNHLLLGWHVLRNRGEKEGTCTDDERDKNEREFFSSGVWGSLPKEDRGIESLRKKLSRIQMSHIQKNLDSLISNIEDQIKERQRRLENLGDARSSPKELRAYLIKLATRYHILALDAVRGNYNDEFFGPLYTETDESSYEYGRLRKLRALVRDMNRAFNHVLVTKGNRRNILPPADNENPTDPPPVAAIPQYLQPLLGLYDFETPPSINWEVLISELDNLASANQGMEFPGSSNDQLALALFRDHSSPWEAIATRHIELVMDLAASFVEILIGHILWRDEDTQAAILREFVNPFFEGRRLLLEEKLRELMKNHTKGYGQPLDSEFLSRVGKVERARMNRMIKNIMKTSIPSLHPVHPTLRDKLWAEMTANIDKSSAEEEFSEFGTDKIIDKMMAYYEISLRTFTENVIVLALENCLISELPDLLTPDKVYAMSDEELKQLASESEAIQSYRDEAQRDLEALKAGLRVCAQYRRRKHAGVQWSNVGAASTAQSSSGRPDSPSSRTNGSAGHGPKTPMQQSGIQALARKGISSGGNRLADSLAQLNINHGEKVPSGATISRNPVLATNSPFDSSLNPSPNLNQATRSQKPTVGTTPVRSVLEVASMTGGSNDAHRKETPLIFGNFPDPLKQPSISFTMANSLGTQSSAIFANIKNPFVNQSSTPFSNLEDPPSEQSTPFSTPNGPVSQHPFTSFVSKSQTSTSDHSFGF